LKREDFLTTKHAKYMKEEGGEIWRAAHGTHGIHGRIEGRRGGEREL
jgi:hypothetical protein